jgi:hypothetical protein
VTAVGGPITRSRIEAFDQTAQVLTDLARLLRAGGERLRQTAAAYVEQVNTPNGVEWEGRAAVAAFDTATIDEAAINRAGSHAHDMADVAKRGGDYLRGARESTLEAIAQAEDEGFTVGEELSVSDNSSSTSAAQRAARLQAAVAHRDYIRHCAARLEAENERIAAQLNAGAVEMASMAPAHWLQPITAFGQPAPREPSVNGESKDKGAVQAVDNKTWKQKPPQPVPPDPQPGPLPPVNNADDVRKALDPLQNGGKRGPNGVGTKPKVKELWDTADIKRMWDYLTRNATDSQGRPGYDGPVRVLPDGTKIGLRQSGKGWGDTLDVWYPDGSDKKIHIPYAPPLISAPPQLPLAAHPAPVPLPPPQVGHPPVALPPTRVVDPATLPPWLQNPSPPGFHVTPSAPPPIAPFDRPEPTEPAPMSPPAPAISPGGSSLLPELARDLAEAGKKAGAGVLAGIAIVGGLVGSGVTSSGQIAR